PVVQQPAPVVQQPAPVVQPAPPAPAAPTWSPAAEVPAGGMAAWAAPDPTQQPVVNLSAGLDLEVAERRGDWARVVAVNGWTGWVDARRLVPRT
ncbi:MAG: SH3 domain-containing protein, partial [Chloroflexota bacterium]